jgi:hypothetical protein
MIMVVRNVVGMVVMGRVAGDMVKRKMRKKRRRKMKKIYNN